MILLTSPRSHVLGSCSHWSFYFLYSSGSRNIQLFSTKAKRNFWTHNHTQSLLKRKQDKASHCRSLLWQLCQDRSGDGCVRLAKQTIRDGRNSTKAAGSRQQAEAFRAKPSRKKQMWVKKDITDTSGRFTEQSKRQITNLFITHFSWMFKRLKLEEFMITLFFCSLFLKHYSLTNLRLWKIFLGWRFAFEFTQPCEKTVKRVI